MVPLGVAWDIFRKPKKIKGRKKINKKNKHQYKIKEKDIKVNICVNGGTGMIRNCRV